MKDILKKVTFVTVIGALSIGTFFTVKNGKFENLEGYMYNLAGTIIESATSSNATSSNATSSNATSSNATSSNATSSNATSSNATSSNATSSNATSSNATSSNATSSNATSSNATSGNVSEKSDSNNNTTIKVDNNVRNDEEISSSKDNKTNEETSNKDKNLDENDEESKQEDEKQEDENQEKNESKTVEYKVSEINSKVLSQIRDSSEITNIVVVVEKDTNISEEIFEAIKGTSKKLTINVGDNRIIFKGKDIKNPKQIDASISYNLISENDTLKTLNQDGVVINFANNGNLPGTATIKIKLTDRMSKVLKTNSIYIYHYDEESKELSRIGTKVTYDKSTGYIEFAISHNSKYVLVNQLLDANIQNASNDEVSFLESGKVYIIIVSASILVIIIVVIILIIEKKKKKNKSDDLMKKSTENVNSNIEEQENNKM